ncbi:unnamed protein product [Moneuplotes crassus]|uniref:Uncharacterized protein n=1 Tax=Euplotes crassus TaxID=5936 RepID=A0AAD1XP62_EUPCR|nr:unnamed protein product [Moneuplotes crassus]
MKAKKTAKKPLGIKVSTQTKIQGWQLDNKMAGGKSAHGKILSVEENKDRAKELENQIELLKISNSKKSAKIEKLNQSIREKPIADSIPFQRISYLEQINSELQAKIDAKKLENANLGKVLLSLREKYGAQKLSERKKEDEFFVQIESIITQYKEENEWLQVQNEAILQEKAELQEKLQTMLLKKPDEEKKE